MKRVYRIGVLIAMAWYTDKVYEAMFKKQYAIK